MTTTPPKITEIRDPNVSFGNINVIINPGDIEIGAVEIKDSSTDVRVNVVPANTAASTASPVMRVQHVDDQGAVLRESTQADILAQLQSTAGGGSALEVTVFNAVTSPGASSAADVTGRTRHTVQHVISGEVTVETRASLDGTNWVVLGVSFDSAIISLLGPYKYLSCNYKSGTGTLTSYLISLY